MHKFLSLALIFSLFAGSAVAQSAAKPEKAAPVAAAATPAASDELVAMLPASELVAVVDTGRVFNDLLPKLAGLNFGGVYEFAKDLSEFIQKTGIDPKRVQSAVLGVNLEGTQGNGVFLVKGLDLTPAQIEAAMKELKAEFKTSEYKSKTVYQVISKVSAPSAGPLSIKSDELALAPLGGQRLAFGDMTAVKKAIDIQAGGDVPAVSKAMIGALAETRQSALIRFAMNVPENLRTQAADQGDLFKSIASIKLILGTLDTAADLSLSLDAVMRTASQSDAGELESSLKGLLVLVKGIFGGGSGDPKTNFIGTLLDQIKIGSKLSDVSLSISIPRSVMDQLSRKPAPAEKK